MKIGIFVDAYFPAVNGVITSVCNLETELKKLGHEVIIVTMDIGYKTNRKDIIMFKGIRYPWKAIREYRFNIVNKKLIDRMGNMKFDVIHSHTEFSIGRLAHKVAHKYNIPFVYTYHTIYEDYMHYLSKRFANPLKNISRKLSKVFCERPDELIVPTRKVKELLLEYGVVNHINIIPTGIDIEAFDKQHFLKKDVNQLKQKYGLKSDEFVLLFIGRVAKEKSIDVLIREFKKCIENHDNLKLVIVGDGPDLKHLKQYVEHLKLHEYVVFTGLIPVKEVPIYYQLGDLFVNASITETQGLTYIEALASSLPLLVKYDINLAGVIQEKVNGTFFYEDDEFCGKVNELLNDKVLLKHMKDNAAKTTINFSKEKYAKNCEMLYNRLIKEKSDVNGNNDNC